MDRGSALLSPAGPRQRMNRPMPAGQRRIALATFARRPALFRLVVLAMVAACRGSASDATGSAGRDGATGGGGGTAPSSGGTNGDGAVIGSGGGLGSGGRAPGSGGDGTGGGAGSGGMEADGSVTDAATGDASANDMGAPDGGGVGTFGGGPVTPSSAHQDIGVHDPSMIWDGKKYYLLATGASASLRGSTNLLQWTNGGRFLAGVPLWVAPALGQAPDGNTPWAPDVSYFNGKFHVYYCASVFGKNTSVIGLATNVSLDPGAAGYAWMDQGLVIQTKSTDNYNAIDPNVAFDGDGVPWLSFGSFWSGIKLRRLDAATGMPSSDDPTVYSLASRNGGAIEAPSIISHGGYYYLFVSFDSCCQGINSTYRTMVGRANAITGPYLDKTGKAMLQSGGDQLLASSGRYIGPGGGTAWKNGDAYLYVYHYYDGQAGGASKLAVRPITFTSDGWITAGDPLFP